MNKVLVYGSLRRGMSNHNILKYSELLGAYTTPKNYQLIDVASGRFPGVVKGNSSVFCEVYKVNDAVMSSLDALEGHPSFYKRVLIDAGKYGPSWIYLYQPSPKPTMPVVIGGDWIKYKRSEVKNGSLL